MTVLAGSARGGPVRHVPAGGGSPRLAQPVRGRGRRTVARSRPAGRPLEYGARPAGTGVSMAPHTPTPEQVRRRVVVLGSVLVLLGVLLVVGLSALRAAGVAPVPTPTGVVQVLPGESLSEVAVRVAPESPGAAVVERIRELNDLSTSTLRTGQSLVVPAG